MSHNAYVYIIRDPTANDEPIYIGKGVRKRAWYHEKRSDDHPLTKRIQEMKAKGV